MFCPRPKIFNPIDAATGSRQAKGTRHPLQMSVTVHPHLHWDPPTTTQLRPPHPALVCFLAATLHSPLLLPHTSSPSPNFLRDLLFAVNCSRSVLSGECQALRANCGEGLLKRGCAWRLRRVRSPPKGRPLACARFICKGTSVRADSTIHSAIQIYYTRRSLPHSHHTCNGGPIECAREDIGR
jgi:hypothetical protein